MNVSSLSTTDRRGIILLYLHDRFPGSFAFSQLRKTLNFLCNGNELRRQLAYLEERGFVAHESIHVGNVTVETFALTADGVDVVGGVISYTGVSIPDLVEGGWGPRNKHGSIAVAKSILQAVHIEPTNDIIQLRTWEQNISLAARYLRTAIAELDQVS